MSHVQHHLVTLRSTPAFLANEESTRLCMRPPPEGLLGSPEALRTLLNQTCTASCPVAEKDQQSQCLLVANQLKARTSGYRQERFRSCAVVGSGGQMRSAHAGRVIDGDYDAVLRFNLAPIAGRYTKHVGKRTTWRVMSHFPWRVVLSGAWAPSMQVPHGEVLYCFNSWLGVCHSEAMISEARPSKGARLRPGRALVVNPVLVSRVVALLLALRNTPGSAPPAVDDEPGHIARALTAVMRELSAPNAD